MLLRERKMVANTHLLPINQPVGYDFNSRERRYHLRKRPCMMEYCNINYASCFTLCGNKIIANIVSAFFFYLFDHLVFDHFCFIITSS